ncbi:hypothetical protein AX15_004324 [Amanita polypyramis BW_CC]|nr:hypothetical protein AX15_004324 [Amanita polypyramis BW_CC]
MPHLGRVGDSDSPSPPPLSPSSSSSSSPPLPTRSPLRPPPRPISSDMARTSQLFTQVSTPPRSQGSPKPDTPPPLAPEDTAVVAATDPPIPGSYPIRIPSGFHTLDGLLDTIANLNPDEHLKMKHYASQRSESPLSISQTEADEERSSSSSSSIGQPQPQPSMSKRQHALQELLSSERAYASDLVLICDLHIPLALGHEGGLHAPTLTPPNSSDSSSRTLSTASDTSYSTNGPPMTLEDTKIIFNNIEDLAVFSESLCDKLEKAVGSGENDDRVGTLFLGMIAEFEVPYKHYITRHPSALAHLQNLPQTSALTNYLSRTQSVASAVSHAWDLASLLIKPVQRLLKYPLLLLAIYEDTPDGHPDKENLELSRKKMEEVARNVNEGRRRAEVVKEVLSSKKKPLSSTVNLSKMKTLRVGSGKLPPAADAENGEAAKVEKMHMELKKIDVFAQQFARSVLEWSKFMGNVVVALRVWAISFGKVIGLSAEQGSEAFDAFLAVVEGQLMSLCVALEAAVNEKLLKEIAHLLTTMTQPFKLIASMNEQEPLHNHLFTMNMNNRRPPPQLVEASNNYRALRGQLAAELPDYLLLMHKGLTILVGRLVVIQREFWRGVRDRWGELWDMLRVEGELNAGSSETIKVWHTRWADVDEIVSAISITQRRKLHTEVVVRSRTSTHSNGDSRHSKQSSPTTANVASVLSALEAVGPYVSPHSISPTRTRPRGSSDASGRPPRHHRPLGRKASNESLRSGIPKQPKSPRRKTDDFSEYVIAQHAQHAHQSSANPQNPPLPRTKSMPLPIGKQVPGRSQSSSRIAATSFASTDSDQTLYYPEHCSPEHHKQKHDHHHSNEDRHSHEHDKDRERERDRDRGRCSRKSSLKRNQEQGKASSDVVENEDKNSKRTNSAKRSSASRQLADSFKSITSLFNSGFSSASSATAVADEAWLVTNQDPRPLTQSQRDSWMNKEAKYVCRVIHACRPPASVSYFSFPFFTLVEDEVYEVLQEAGHPSIHPKLPLYVDDGEDCLLLCRDADRNVGWALASFLEPLDVLASDHRR